MLTFYLLALYAELEVQLLKLHILITSMLKNRELGYID